VRIPVARRSLKASAFAAAGALLTSASVASQALGKARNDASFSSNPGGMRSAALVRT
jgi:hypothetical protein